MRNAFAKRFAAVMLALGMLSALPVATAYAADDTGYVVTFRSGEHGTFSTTYIDNLKTTYGSGDVWVNNDAEPTVVSVLVMDKENAPGAPIVTNDVIINDDSPDYEAVAAVNDDTYPAGGIPTKDYDFVVEYALSGTRQDVSYVIHYYLQGTTEEVAPSVRGTAREKMTYTFTAAAVNEYTVVGSSVQSVTMTKNADSSPVEITFYYTQNEHVNSVTQYEDGGTVVQYNDVNVAAGGAATTGGAAAGGAAGAGAAAGGGAAGGVAAGGAAGGAGAAAGGDQNAAAEAPQAGGEEGIGENETPQAGGNESIGENETPLAGSESGGVNVPLVAGGVAAVVIIAAIVAVVIRKRGNGAN